MMIGLMSKGEPKIPSTEENEKITARLVEEWNLGPKKGSDEPGSNVSFWQKLAKVWGISEEKARRQRCANCEYFVDTPSMLKKLEKVDYNEMDKTGGGRGFCRKFDFICHNLRTCQAWETNDPAEEMEMEED